MRVGAEVLGLGLSSLGDFHRPSLQYACQIGCVFRRFCVISNLAVPWSQCTPLVGTALLFHVFAPPCFAGLALNMLQLLIAETWTLARVDCDNAVYCCIHMCV